MSYSISDRAQHLLKILIEQYIRQGQPIASKALASASSLSLSPATVRNIMSELEANGFLASPHTSAGRVPTALGYRFFVDSLLTVRPMSEGDVAAVKGALDPGLESKHLIQRTSQLLSSITQLAGLVTLPKASAVLLKQIEFVPLSDNRVLVILVINDNEIQNRIVYTDRIYSRDELHNIANYLTQTFVDVDLTQIRIKILASMQADRAQMDHLMKTALDLADKVIAAQTDFADSYMMAGEVNLLQMMDIASIDRLRELFSLFTEKQRVLDLLDRSLLADGVQIFIGEESGHPLFQECSLISAFQDRTKQHRLLEFL
jgi:heat-inducible transcriptional repressor